MIQMLKIKYIGETIVPLALAMNSIPAVTNGEIYEAIIENEETNTYVFIDDLGMKKVLKKDKFEKLWGDE